MRSKGSIRGVLTRLAPLGVALALAFAAPPAAAEDDGHPGYGYQDRYADFGHHLGGRFPHAHVRPGSHHHSGVPGLLEAVFPFPLAAIRGLSGYDPLGSLYHEEEPTEQYREEPVVSAAAEPEEEGGADR